MVFTSNSKVLATKTSTLPCLSLLIALAICSMLSLSGLYDCKILVASSSKPAMFLAPLILNGQIDGLLSLFHDSSVCASMFSFASKYALDFVDNFQSRC